MFRNRPLVLVSLALLTLLVAIAAAAEAPANDAPAPPGDAATAAPSAALLCAPPTFEVARKDGASPGIGALATCTAQCWDGTTRVCDAGTSCTAVDSSCPSPRGHCWDNVGGTKVCPPCPCPDPLCDDLDGSSCKGSGSVTCYFGPTCHQTNCTCNGSVYICP